MPRCPCPRAWWSGRRCDLAVRPTRHRRQLGVRGQLHRPRDDVTVRATLPLPVVSIKFIPPGAGRVVGRTAGPDGAVAGLASERALNVGAGAGASLPGVVFTGEVRYASHTQRPRSAGRRTTGGVAQQTEDGADHYQDAGATPAGWEMFWRRTLPRLKASRIGCPRSWTHCLYSRTARPAAARRPTT